MENETYLYHYYPLRDANKLESIPNIEHATMECLLREYGKTTEPFTSLYRATLPLVEKKIWMNRAEELNDPFECLSYLEPDQLNQNELTTILNENEFIKSELLSEINKGKKLIPFKIMKSRFYGLFSLCKDHNIPLMWSHYANSHMGLCIRFKVHNKLKPAIRDKQMQIIKFDNGPGFIFSNIDPAPEPLRINSATIRHYINEYNKRKDKILAQGIRFGTHDLMYIMIMLFKDTRWSYENEFRLITLGLEKDLFLPALKYPGTEEHPLEADAIIFGTNTHPIAKKILQNSFNIPFFQSNIDHGTYNLKISPITKSTERSIIESAEIF